MVTLDHPPANALGAPILDRLHAAFDAAEQAGEVKVMIVCSAVELSRATAAAADLHAALSGSPLPADASVLGPAALFRLRGRERQVLVIKAEARREAAQAVGAAVQQLADARAHGGVSFSVDVDPQ